MQTIKVDAVACNVKVKHLRVRFDFTSGSVWRGVWRVLRGRGFEVKSNGGASARQIRLIRE